MAMLSPPRRQRSSMEEMLETMRNRDERSHDSPTPPQLPLRPISKARPPSKRFIQSPFKFSPVNAQRLRIEKESDNMANVALVYGDSIVSGDNPASVEGDRKLTAFLA